MADEPGRELLDDLREAVASGLNVTEAAVELIKRYDSIPPLRQWGEMQAGAIERQQRGLEREQPMTVHELAEIFHIMSRDEGDREIEVYVEDEHAGYAGAIVDFDWTMVTDGERAYVGFTVRTHSEQP